MRVNTKLNVQCHIYLLIISALNLTTHLGGIIDSTASGAL